MSRVGIDRRGCLANNRFIRRRSRFQSSGTPCRAGWWKPIAGVADGKLVQVGPLDRGPGIPTAGPARLPVRTVQRRRPRRPVSAADLFGLRGGRHPVAPRCLSGSRAGRTNCSGRLAEKTRCTSQPGQTSQPRGRSCQIGCRFPTAFVGPARHSSAAAAAATTITTQVGPASATRPLSRGHRRRYDGSEDRGAPGDTAWHPGRAGEHTPSSSDHTVPTGVRLHGIAGGCYRLVERA